MHEAYYAPKGHHEQIYGNFRRWGMGMYTLFCKMNGFENANGLSFVGAIKSVGDSKETAVAIVDTLVPNKKGSTMYSRMGRKGP
jgi:Zn-dependent oligopeptidase